MFYSVSLAEPARLAHWLAVALILVGLGTANAAPTTVAQVTATGISLPPGFCASIFGGQYRTCKTHRGLALGRRLRQHLERHLLQLGSHSTRRLPRRSKGYPEDGQGRCREAIRREQGGGCGGLVPASRSTRARYSLR